MNPLLNLHTYGQSFWYDNIRRTFLQDGTVQQLIDNDGLRGMTSNPSIFEKAIGNSDDYDAQLRQLAAEGADVMTAYEAMAIADIQAACDLFAPLYTLSDRTDGFVSLEVSPYLAHDTEGTAVEAKRLFTAVSRPNLMIKIPATVEGIPAITDVIAAGINVNVTLMFNMPHYNAVAEAYIEGMTRWIDADGDPAQVASVASFFVSRVDTAVDNALADNHLDLLGKAAIANSRVVYQQFKNIFHGERFAALQAAGARRQRLLWASTSVKNRAYSDTRYIDELIGEETVNTIPPATIDAFRDHGHAASTLETAVADSYTILSDLAEAGIDLTAVTEQLQADGVASFSKAFDTLLAVIKEQLEIVK